MSAQVCILLGVGQFPFVHFYGWVDYSKNSKYTLSIPNILNKTVSTHRQYYSLLEKK